MRSAQWTFGEGSEEGTVFSNNLEDTYQRLLSYHLRRLLSRLFLFWLTVKDKRADLP